MSGPSGTLSIIKSLYIDVFHVQYFPISSTNLKKGARTNLFLGKRRQIPKAGVMFIATYPGVSLIKLQLVDNISNK